MCVTFPSFEVKISKEQFRNLEFLNFPFQILNIFAKLNHENK